MFALFWSIGCTVTLDGRTKFNAWIREKMTAVGIEFPEDRMVFDYKWNHEVKEW